MTLPTFVIVGAMRSGSTSLYKYLQEHPDVWMPRKEIHFFDVRWDHGLDWYRTKFDGYDGQPMIGEATPTYLTEPVALDRMAATIPTARLLAVLRDPVERAYSHYWMEHARDRDLRSFDDAVVDELAGRTATSSYLDRGRYAAQLDRLEQRFPPEQVHVLLLDDLEQEPDATYAEVCRFLGIDDTFRPAVLGRRVNDFVTFRSSRVRSIHRRLPKRFRIRRIVDRLNARHDQYPPLEEATAARLRAHFAQDDEALATRLGRPLPWR